MKNTIEFLKELREKHYGKAAFFFGFYLIFFIVIFLIFSIGGKDTNKNDNNADNKYFKNYNYSYEYKVVLDNNTYTYTGSKEGIYFKYNYNGKEYYSSGSKSFVKEEEVKEVDNPVKFSKFFDEDIIVEIINASYIDSHTTYGNGEALYNLLTSSNTLNKILDGKETDYDEVPNKIKITVKEKHISEINYNLDSYCKNNDSCNSLNITISYSNYSSKS